MKELFRRCDSCKRRIEITDGMDDFVKTAMTVTPYFNAFDTGKHNWNRWFCPDCIWELIGPAFYNR